MTKWGRRKTATGKQRRQMRKSEFVVVVVVVVMSMGQDVVPIFCSKLSLECRQYRQGIRLFFSQTMRACKEVWQVAFCGCFFLVFGDEVYMSDKNNMDMHGPRPRQPGTTNSNANNNGHKTLRILPHGLSCCCCCCCCCCCVGGGYLPPKCRQGSRKK